MTVLVIYFILWILLGLLVGALVSLIGNAPPYGIAVDLSAAVLVMVVVGLLDFVILPRLGYSGPIRFIAMIGEPLLSALLVLWLLRFVKRRRKGGSE